MLTINELAARYRVGTGVIRRAYACGAFPAPIRIGKLLRWKSEAIEAWELLAEQTTKTNELEGAK